MHLIDLLTPSRVAAGVSVPSKKRLLDQVVLAMQHATTGTRAIENFVLAPRFEGTPRYRLYVDAGDAGAIDALEANYERALCGISVEYADKRKSLRLSPVELVCVRQGFLRSRDGRLRRDRSHTAEQFKHQYLLPRPNLDDDLATAATQFASAG